MSYSGKELPEPLLLPVRFTVRQVARLKEGFIYGPNEGASCDCGIRI